jgi:glycerol-3-phosphate acyltransferase PlsY
VSSVLLGCGGSLVAAYLIGGIPFALVVGRAFFGVDLRTRGSGNLGATNTFRVLGPLAGSAVLLLDAAKGAGAVVLASFLLRQTGADLVVDPEWFLLLVTFAVMAGHIYSPYLRFRGGKGVAAAAGALFVIMWPVILVLLVLFVVVLAVFRMVSLASVVGAAIFPLLSYLMYSHDPVAVALTTLAAVLVIWRHRGNISRIIRGEEPKIGRRERGDGE